MSTNKYTAWGTTAYGDDRDKLEVALTKCYFCGGDHQIVLNKRLTRRDAAQVKEMHGKVIDMTPCNECQSLMDQGVILIAIDLDRSDPGWDREDMPNPYRTGGWWVVTDEGIKRILPPELAEWAIQHRWMFIDYRAAAMMNLPLPDRGGEV
jgi:hypothetical protein